MSMTLRRRGGASGESPSPLEVPKASAATPRFLLVAKDTFLWHGARAEDGSERPWYASPDAFPNKIGEDGGTSFTLDYGATPKTRNAHIILQYKARHDFRALICASKGDFHHLLTSGTAICYTRVEEEVVFAQGQAQVNLKFHGFLDTRTGTFTAAPG
jgi:hypothetical protein